MRFKNYLLRLLIVTALLLAVVASVNYLIDPMGVFGTASVHGLNERKPFMGQTGRHHMVIHKANVLRDGDYQGVVLGTSRVYRGIDPLTLPIEGNIYNGGFGGASARGIYLMFRAGASSGALKSAIVGLEYESFIRPAEPVTRSIQALENLDQFHGDVSDILGIENLAYSLGTLALNVTGTSILNRADGFRAPRSSKKAGYKHFFMHSIGLIQLYEVALQVNTDFPWLEKIVNLARRQDIELTFVILPLHSSVSTLMMACDKYRDFDRWRQGIDQFINSNRPGGVSTDRISLWDFSQPGPYSSEDVPLPGNDGIRWFFDSIHFKPELSRLAFRQIFLGEMNAVIQGKRVEHGSGSDNF